MSYCRWECDNHKSDIYAYRSRDGFVIHVRAIGLVHDGETFMETSLSDFMEQMIYLRDIGYHIPDFVFERIEKELKDDKNGL